MKPIRCDYCGELVFPDPGDPPTLPDHDIVFVRTRDGDELTVVLAELRAI